MSNSRMVKLNKTYSDFEELYLQSKKQFSSLDNRLARLIAYFTHIIFCVMLTTVTIMKATDVFDLITNIGFYILGTYCFNIFITFLVKISGFTMKRSISDKELSVLKTTYEKIDVLKKMLDDGIIKIKKEGDEMSLLFEGMGEDAVLEELLPFYDFYRGNRFFFNKILKLPREIFLLSCLSLNFTFLDTYYAHKARLTY